MLDRLWQWCKESATIVWARLLILGGILLSIANEIAALAQASNLVQFLPQRWTSIALAVIGVITELARRRSLR